MGNKIGCKWVSAILRVLVVIHTVMSLGQLVSHWKSFSLHPRLETQACRPNSGPHTDAQEPCAREATGCNRRCMLLRNDSAVTCCMGPQCEWFSSAVAQVKDTKQERISENGSIRGSEKSFQVSSCIHQS